MGMDHSYYRYHLCKKHVNPFFCQRDTYDTKSHKDKSILFVHVFLWTQLLLFLCRCLNTIHACWRYTLSLSLSVPLPQYHTGMLAVHTFSFSFCAAASIPHRHVGGTHFLFLCRCLNTTQACWRYTLSLSLSVPLPQYHTGMLAVHTFSFSFCAAASIPHRHVGGTHFLFLFLCRCLNTTQACWRYTLSLSLSVPLPQYHTGMLAVHTFSFSFCVTTSIPHRHVGGKHFLMNFFFNLLDIFCPTCMTPSNFFHTWRK